VGSAGERDQTVERLLRQSIKTPPRGGVTDACLDPETLAAWTDGGLSGSELEAVQLHVANCARCQDLAGTLARMPPAVHPVEPVHSSRRWLAWFVPLTAAAAAAVIWFVVPGNLGAPLNKREVAVVSETPTGQVDAQNRAVQPAASEPSVPSPARRDEPQAPPATQTPQGAGTLEGRARADVNEPSTVARAEEKESADNLSNDKDKAEAVRAPAAPPPAAAAQAAAAPAAERLGAAAMRAANVVVQDIVSPDPAVRWRIVGAAVQHSANGGSTWEAVPIGIAAELTTGAAPATTVCWLVGRGGVVLLTTDGRTWRRVPFPEMTDLSLVRTVDAGGRVASVSTADGRTFVTTDAGATWAPR
jgi:Putative zinc-finger